MTLPLDLEAPSAVDVTHRADAQWPLTLTPDEQAVARLIPMMRHGVPVAWTVVDADVYPALNMWRWELSPSGYAMRKMSIGGKSVNVRMHRVVMCLTPRDGMVIDHINRCRLDNRRVNLRYTTYGENNRNRDVIRPRRYPHPRPRWYERDRRWIARFQRNGIVHKVGRFTDYDEAVAALDTAVRTFDDAH